MITGVVAAILAALLLAGCQQQLIPTDEKIDVVIENPTLLPATSLAAAKPQLAVDRHPTATAVSGPGPTRPQPVSPPKLRATSTLTHAALEQSLPAAKPTLFPTLDGSLPTPPLPVPQAATPIANEDDLIVIALLGNDVPWPQGGRTDSIILISWHRQQGKVNVISLPRDLYVVIPGWKMDRLNLALPHGHGSNYPGGGGGLLKDTLLYNLGIPVDYYVRVGFSGFKTIVDQLGGVEVVVNCPIDDWRLREPDLDPQIAQNWEPFLLTTGVHQMDGELALWYVRSRHNSNDIDRGRRQQKIVRALVQQAQTRQIVRRLPQLWHDFAEMFETDMRLTDAVQLAAFGSRIDDINHLLFSQTMLHSWQVPQSGESVQLLDRAAAETLLRQFMGASALHEAEERPIKVVVETDDPVLYRQVADNLLWYGFEPSWQYRENPAPQQTTIRLKSSSLKGNQAGKLAAVFGQDETAIILVAAIEAETASYHVDLGRMVNPCLPYFEAAHDPPAQKPANKEADLPAQNEFSLRNRRLD